MAPVTQGAELGKHKAKGREGIRSVSLKDHFV